MGMRATTLVLGVGLVLLAGSSAVWSQQVHRNGFETVKPVWAKSGFDAPYEELAHAITDQGPHDGQRCEYLKLNAKAGNFIYYQYTTGRAPISDEMAAGVWVKSNRPGAQLMARVVLPNERDPNNLEFRLNTVIRGDAYQNAGRWQFLRLGRAAQLAKQQQQLMQAQVKRSLNFDGAYLDALVLNVYAGPGPTEVWIDDLEVGPIAGEPAPQTARVPNQGASQPKISTPNVSTPRNGGRNMLVEFNGSQLMVAGKRIFFRGIRHSDTPLRALRDAGFNTIFFDHSATPSLLQEAADLGMWTAPHLKILADDARGVAAEEIAKELNRFSGTDAVLFWHLGGTLAYEQAQPVSRAASIIRQADPGRPLAADVWDGFMPYSRSLNLVGVHRWPLMTTLELPKYREWLDQRRRLAANGSFMWTWIQTHMPEWYTTLLYDRTAHASFNEPIGPQPEQIRLLTYTALASGARGIAFWSDRFLADSHQGRDRLLACAILNQELEMLEPLLVTVEDPPQWIDTSSPEVKAAVFRTAKGVLVLPIWLGQGAQFVPGQAAISKLTMVVPQVPQSQRGYEIMPADIRGLRAERVTGGTKVTVPEFGLTSAIFFTSDTTVLARFQDIARQRRQQVAQWTYDMAVYEMEKVLKVHEQLAAQGRSVNDAQHLINDAQNRLKSAKELWDNRLFAEAYHESQRSLRPLRILMRAEWEQAVKGLDTPVASPFAVTYYTLPRHWTFMNEFKGTAAANVLPGGDFELVSDKTQDAWKVEEPTLDEVELLAQRVGQVQKAITTKGDVATAMESPQQGKQCAMLQIKPRGKGPAPQALERTLLAISSPAVKLQPGTLVQISGWVRIPAAITASPDGALLYDSAGGEPLAIRLTEPTPWKKYTLYRRVPASGQISVTLALTGLGTVYFDDVRIEPVVPSSNTPSNPMPVQGTPVSSPRN